jgi:hypothetical protein
MSGPCVAVLHRTSNSVLCDRRDPGSARRFTAEYQVLIHGGQMSGCLRGISAAKEFSVLQRHRSHRWPCHRHSCAVPFRVPEPPIIFSTGRASSRSMFRLLWEPTVLCCTYRQNTQAQRTTVLLSSPPRRSTCCRSLPERVAPFQRAVCRRRVRQRLLRL